MKDRPSSGKPDLLAVPSGAVLLLAGIELRSTGSGRIFGARPGVCDQVNPFDRSVLGTAAVPWPMGA
jgi:hypothetical protein